MFETYASRYSQIRMERRDGILQLTFHSDGGPFQWGLVAHDEFPDAFANIARDRDNRVVIMTGVGDVFSGPRGTAQNSLAPERPDAALLDRFHRDGRALLMNLLAIEAPIIAAVNGPAWRHSELPLLSDIVLAADTAKFQDSSHFISGVAPGDGLHVIYPMLLGFNRARYFMLTGQTLDAMEAHQLGLVAEVLPPDRLLARAWELAEELARQPPILLRNTRLLFAEQLRQKLSGLLGYGLALQGVALLERAEQALAEVRQHEEDDGLGAA
jgi:enoyl-CoA hydratase/carnithine racemase